jgi:iron(III) transport system permease protein
VAFSTTRTEAGPPGVFEASGGRSPADLKVGPLLPRLAGYFGAGPRASALPMILVLGAFSVVPVFFVFRQALANGAAGFSKFFASPDLLTVIRTTVLFSLGSGAIAMILGPVLAWWAHRLPPNRRWLGVTPFLSVIVPQIAMVTGYVFLLNPSIGYLNVFFRSILGVFGITLFTGPVNVYSTPWIVIVNSFHMTAFVFLFVRSALAHLNQDIIDAASTSGAGPVRLFATVVLPIIRPALAYAAITVLILGLGTFTAPLILGTPNGIDVLSTKMFTAVSNAPADHALAAAYGLPILIAGIVLLGGQRLLLRDQSRYVTTGGRNSRPLSQGGVFVQVGLAIYGLIALVLPLAALLLVSFQPFWSQNIVASDFTLANFRQVLTTPSLVATMYNSMLYALGAAVIALPLAHICARIIFRWEKRAFLSGVMDMVVSIPLGIPAGIFGVGFLVLFTETPIRLYGNGFGVVLVYVAVVLPFATRLQLAALGNLGTELHSVAAACGAGLMRRILTVDIPLLRTSFGASAALIVVLASHEFSASIFIVSVKTQVMGTQLYELFNYSSYSAAAAMAVVMCLITVVGVCLAFFTGGAGALNRAEGGH